MVPSTLPEGDPAARPTARCPPPRLAGVGPRAVRHLPPRAVLRDPLRLLRLQHLHRDRARRRGEPGVLRRRLRSRSSTFARGVLGDVDLPGADGLLRRRHADPAAGRLIWRAMLAAVRDRFGLAPDAEVTTEANPDSVDARSLAALREAGFTRVSFGMQSRGAARARDARSRAHARARAAGGRGGQRRPASSTSALT